MRRSRLVAMSAAVLAGVLVLSACGRAAEETDQPTGAEGEAYLEAGIYEQEAPGDPTPGGTLTFADFAESVSLDPTTGSWTGYSAGTPLVAVYDQLVRWNEREQDFEPRLAESVEPNADHTQWTINLRPDVTFSDGTPVNADAVIGSFNYYLHNRGYDLSVVGPLWGGAEKVDDLTVQVNLTDSWATFPFALGRGMGFIAAPAAIANGPEGFEPIGAGAFTFSDYSPQEQLLLSANPTYWDGAPYVAELRFVWLGPDDTKYESFRGGNAHATIVRDIELVKEHREAGLSGWVSAEGLGNMINISSREGRPGQSLTVRRAVAHAIDEQALYDRVFDGLGTPSKRLFGPRSHWFNEQAEPPTYDLELAQELLEQAKQEGFDGQIVLTSLSDPVSRDQALTLQAQLEAAGFTVEHDFARTVAENIAKVYVEGNFEFSRSALSVSESDPFWRFASNFYSGSPGNTADYADPELDALIDELRVTAGEERRDVLNRIEARFLDQVPHISLADSNTLVAWSDEVHGIVPTNDAMLGFEKAWIATG